MTRLIAHIDGAVAPIGLAMSSFQGMLVRIGYVGITGLIIELFSRAVVIAAYAVLAHLRARR